MLPTSHKNVIALHRIYQVLCINHVKVLITKMKLGKYCVLQACFMIISSEDCYHENSFSEHCIKHQTLSIQDNSNYCASIHEESFVVYWKEPTRNNIILFFIIYNILIYVTLNGCWIKLHTYVLLCWNCYLK